MLQAPALQAGGRGFETPAAHWFSPRAWSRVASVWQVKKKRAPKGPLLHHQPEEKIPQVSAGNQPALKETLTVSLLDVQLSGEHATDALPPS